MLYIKNEDKRNFETTIKFNDFTGLKFLKPHDRYITLNVKLK